MILVKKPYITKKDLKALKKAYENLDKILCRIQERGRENGENFYLFSVGKDFYICREIDDPDSVDEIDLHQDSNSYYTVIEDSDYTFSANVEVGDF